MTPTIQELSAIAASLPTGTAPDRAREALAIWKSCIATLEHDQHVEDQSKRWGEPRIEALDKLGDGEIVTLDTFLKTAMPRSKPEDRMAKFRKYQKRIAEAVHHLEGDDIDDYARRTIADAKGAGWAKPHAAEMAIGFGKFLEADRAAMLSERGKKGHEKKSLAKKKRPQIATSKKKAAPSKKRAAPSRK